MMMMMIMLMMVVIMIVQSMTLHTDYLTSSLNVLIHSDLAAGSSNQVMSFCDDSGGIPPCRCAVTKCLTKIT